MKVQVACMVDFWNWDFQRLDYGNNIRQVPRMRGLENAFAFPGLSSVYSPRLSCRGIAPFPLVRRCRANPEEYLKTDAKGEGKTYSGLSICHNWLDMARERIGVSGLSAQFAGSGLGVRTSWPWPLMKWSGMANYQRRCD